MQGRAGHASSRLTKELYALLPVDPTARPPMPLEHRFRSALRAPYGHAAGKDGR